jgi:hypothetical protein
VGVAMGESGTAIASEASHVVLLRDDWGLAPDLLRIAQRTMRVVKGNLGFTVADRWAWRLGPGVRRAWQTVRAAAAEAARDTAADAP